MDEVRTKLENEQLALEKKIGFMMKEIKKFEEQIKELNTAHLKNQGKLELLSELEKDQGEKDVGKAEPGTDAPLHDIPE